MFDAMLANDVPDVLMSAHGGHKSLKSKENYVSKTDTAKKALNRILGDSLKGEEAPRFQELVEEEQKRERDKIKNIRSRGASGHEDKENVPPVPKVPLLQPSNSLQPEPDQRSHSTLPQSCAVLSQPNYRASPQQLANLQQNQGTHPQQLHGAGPQQDQGVIPLHHYGANPLQQQLHGGTPQLYYGTSPQLHYGASPQLHYGTSPQLRYGANPQLHYGESCQLGYGPRPQVHYGDSHLQHQGTSPPHQLLYGGTPQQHHGVGPQQILGASSLYHYGHGGSIPGYNVGPAPLQNYNPPTS